jgi:hypothetical protein
MDASRSTSSKLTAVGDNVGNASMLLNCSTKKEITELVSSKNKCVKVD